VQKSNHLGGEGQTSTYWRGGVSAECMPYVGESEGNSVTRIEESVIQRLQA
jgi:hypothetical protein